MYVRNIEEKKQFKDAFVELFKFKSEWIVHAVYYKACAFDPSVKILCENLRRFETKLEAKEIYDSIVSIEQTRFFVDETYT